jgi:hypothetical protein
MSAIELFKDSKSQKRLNKLLEKCNELSDLFSYVKDSLEIVISLSVQGNQDLADNKYQRLKKDKAIHSPLHSWIINDCDDPENLLSECNSNLGYITSIKNYILKLVDEKNMDKLKTEYLSLRSKIIKSKEFLFSNYFKYLELEYGALFCEEQE